MASNTNLIDVIKTAAAANLVKATGEDAAFEKVLKEAQLSRSELSDLWMEYSYMIDDRTGYPYNYVPVYLPRQRVHVTTINKGKGKTVKETNTVTDSDSFTVPDCAHTFSRKEFYGNRNFQGAIRRHYRTLGHSVSFQSTRKGWIMKVYMD